MNADARLLPLASLAAVLLGCDAGTFRAGPRWPSTRDAPDSTVVPFARPAPAVPPALDLQALAAGRTILVTVPGESALPVVTSLRASLGSRGRELTILPRAAAAIELAPGSSIGEEQLAAALPPGVVGRTLTRAGTSRTWVFELMPLT